MIPSSPHSDQRIAARFPVRIHIRFRLMNSPSGEPPESELHNGNNLMSNVSRTGFFLATKNYIEIGSLLEVEFPLEEFKQVVRAEAEVVRANHANFPNHGKYEYGLRFRDMHPHFREIMEKFIEFRVG
ncbi:MAG TPA: PilZ domain-containing protein [bacterium]|nr:PilZ domain-containing protein [bacterium]